MSSQYGELRLTNGWDLLASLGHPCKFQRVSRLGSVTARHSSIGRQPNFAALNRGRHQYSAGRPSRWVLAHISSLYYFVLVLFAFVMAALRSRCGHYIFALYFVMVALWNRADHYIFALLFLTIYLLPLSFFHRLISAAIGWMSTILWHMVWP